MNENMIGFDTRPAQIMLIEDNPGDVVLMKRAFERSTTTYHTEVFTNGEDVIRWIDDVKHKNNTFNPDIIFLDLNLPRIDGLELLQKFKKDKRLRYVPVLIVSSSSSEEDVTRCYDAYANGYVSKPKSLEEFDEFVEQFSSFWFRRAILPTSVVHHPA